MEPEGSLPHSQVQTTCPYPEPARSSPTPTSYFLKIHLNIILPSTPGSPKWSLSLRFPHQNPVYASPIPYTRYMSLPSHSSRFYHSNNIGRGVNNVKYIYIYFFIYSLKLILIYFRPTGICQRKLWKPNNNRAASPWWQGGANFEVRQGQFMKYKVLIAIVFPSFL
jgi:hypothetical protein